MKKVFIGGSRRLGRLNAQVRSRTENMIKDELQVLVGDANGADKAIQKFFSDHGYKSVTVYFAGEFCRNNLGHWDTRRIEVDHARRDFKFFTAKDIAMSEEADYGFMIWDGESQGTVNNILNLLERGKKVVVYHSSIKEFMTLRSVLDATELLKRIDPEVAEVLDKKVGLRRRVAASQQSLSLT